MRPTPRLRALCLALALPGFALAADPVQEIGQALDRFHEAASRADGEAYFALFARNGVFIGTAAAVRRNDHLYLAVLAESFSGNKRLFFETFNRVVVLVGALCLVYFGYLNFLDGFRSLRMPSMTPLASLYAAIPLCGVLVALFTIEQLVNGWKNGFAEPAGDPAAAHGSPGSVPP